MFSFLQKKNKRKAEFNYLKQLDSIPVRNRSVSTVESGEGYLVVSLPLEYSGAIKVLARVFKARTEKRFRLEGLGLQIYQFLDGNKTIEDLIDSLLEQYKLSFFESRALVIQYMHSLIKRGLVAVAVKED